jgi:hypothetical protein
MMTELANGCQRLQTIVNDQNEQKQHFMKDAQSIKS